VLAVDTNLIEATVLAPVSQIAKGSKGRGIVAYSYSGEEQLQETIYWQAEKCKH
jgi:hypothetical protein